MNEEDSFRIDADILEQFRHACELWVTAGRPLPSPPARQAAYRELIKRYGAKTVISHQAMVIEALDEEEANVGGWRWCPDCMTRQYHERRGDELICMGCEERKNVAS